MDKDNELIESYILGKLNEDAARKFLFRLEDDREFARKYRLMSTFPEMMSEKSRSELEQKQLQLSTPPQITKGRNPFMKKYGMPVGVSVVILSVIIFLSYFIFSGNGKEPALQEKQELPAPVSVSGADTVNKGVVKKQTTEIQNSGVKTEKPLIQEKTPSQGHGLLSPADGAKLSRSTLIRFQWAMKTDTFTRLVVISNNTGKIVLWKGIRPGTQSIDIEGQKLYPGQYSWFVGTKEFQRSFIVTE